MRILISDKFKIHTFHLPNNIEESYLITYYHGNEKEEKNLTIVAQNNQWILKSNNSFSILKEQQVLNEVVLNSYDYYELKFNDIDDKIILFFIPSIESTKYDYSLSNINNITIGSSQTSNIYYNDNLILPTHANITKNEQGWLLQDNDENGRIYINNIRIKQKQLKTGDLIFINGLRIIWMNTFIRINNPKNKIIIKGMNPCQNDKISNNQITPVTEKEKNINLYNENDYFFHTPRLKSSLKNEIVSIDPPPEPNIDDDLPLFITLGSTITLGMTSMITGFISIYGLATGTSTFLETLPSLFICLSMFLACIFFPILTEKYQKKKLIKREKLRQDKYSKYLVQKQDKINQIIKRQEEILRENFITLQDCVKMLANKDKKIWNREIIDNDFLTIRLGLGHTNADITIEAPTEHFSLDDDNLRENVLKIANKPMILENVPIVVSLTENNVFPLILECQNKTGFIDGIILQLMSFYSSMDLKLVFLIDDKNLSYWKNFKILSHCWSEDKSTRFFASTEEEMKQISTILENEYNKRISKINNNEENENMQKDKPEKYYVNFPTYYLIITDNFKMAKEIPIINKILESNSNLGFSLLMIESTMKNLPSRCNLFGYIVDNSSGIFSKDLSDENQTVFNAEYLTNTNMNSCISIVSNIPTPISKENESLPTTLEFLEMYHVGKIEQLNIINRWQTSSPTTTLSAPIGVHKNGTTFELNLHEKFHGPHGLIAGSTGSGKSEFIITYILSMAVNYHPYEVQFVLIDYKGGGLAGAFENRDTGVKLPHLVGTITNLDTSEMNRTLVSIRSELTRRQKIFNDVRNQLGESTIDIYKYQKLYREGIIKEPISHLFIISDEFAELKSQQPDFMDELITTARIGRSLGVHLILATQKPSGVVDDQIWSNSRFKVCLKVQTSSDSIEMLKRPEAASIKETGRFYLQVGYDELFELGQSAWTGAKYVPKEQIVKRIDDSINFVDNTGYVIKSINDVVQKETNVEMGEQLTNIVNYLYDIATKQQISFNQLWLPNIKNEIFLQDIIKKYNYTTQKFKINAVIGEYDNPAGQQQNILTFNLTDDGNILIYGLPGSGKENLLTTMIYSICIGHSPEEINFYILDFGAEVLKIFKDMPQVGSVLTIDEKDKVTNLFEMLEKEITKRKDLFVDYGGSHYSYCTKSGSSVPLIVTILSNYEAFLENFGDEYEEYLIHLLREGIKYGILFVVTAASTNTVRTKTSQNFQNIVGLRFADDLDYRFVLNAPSGLIPAKTFGRGIAIVDKNAYEFQTAYITKKDTINEMIKVTSTKLIEFYKTKARDIPIIPKIVTSEIMVNEINGLENIPVGIDNKDLTTVKYDFTKTKITPIIGNSILDFPGFICGIIDEIATVSEAKLTIIDAVDKIANDNENVQYINSDFDDEIINIINNIKNQNDEEKNIILIIGIKSLIDEISDETYISLSEVLEKIKTFKNTYFIISDNYSSYRKIMLEDWYRNSIDNSSGIWLGTGVNIQVAITINNLSISDSNQDFEDLAYVVNNGNYKLIKGLTIPKEEE